MFIFLLLITSSVFSVQAMVTFDIRNLEVGQMWIGIKQNEGKDIIEDGGFQLGAGQQITITVPDDWAGTLWPRTWCGWPRARECLTGDCGKKLECAGSEGRPPFSSIYIELNGKGGHDTYSVSLAKGYNVGVSIEPVNGERNSSHHYSCSKAACVFNFQQNCPGPLRQRHENQIVACYSPCVTFATDDHCCHPSSENEILPEICKTLEWRDIQPKHFKKFCPDALTYVHDKKNIFTCKAKTYKIKFGGAW